MSTRTYEELLAAQTELMHFNPNHDPKTGQFSKSKFGQAMSKRKEHRAMKKDMDEHFRSQISDEAAKVTRLGRNGYDERGSEWNTAYRKGKVTSKDSSDIRKASSETRKYMKDKYGDDKFQEMSRRHGESVFDYMDPKKSKILKTAGIVALSAAGVSILATAGNAINAQKGLDAMGFGDKLITSQVVKAGAKKAGQMAVGGALATIGGHMIKDYISDNESHKKKSGE